jgi:hypothetical protein
MIQCQVNGVQRSFDGDPGMPLLWYLRDRLQLTGTKYGCGIGLCGACTVHVDGAATRSCLMPMSGAAGKDIQADPNAYDELVNTWKSWATATLVIDGEVIIGFQANRKRVEALLA